jgi:hypothetical protein
MYKKWSLQLLGQWGSNWLEHSDGGLISSRGIHNVADLYLSYLTKISLLQNVINKNVLILDVI